MLNFLNTELSIEDDIINLKREQISLARDDELAHFFFIFQYSLMIRYFCDFTSTECNIGVKYWMPELSQISELNIYNGRYFTFFIVIL